MVDSAEATFSSLKNLNEAQEETQEILGIRMSQEVGTERTKMFRTAAL